MRRLATAFFALLLLSSPALAAEINGGTLDFDYVGAANGSFGSSGSLVADPETEGTAAVTYSLDGLEYLTVVGALDNGSNFVDGGVLVISSAVPVVPGVYTLNGTTAWFVFVDDAVGWVPPADLYGTNWTNELASITASGKYVSVSGTVTVITVTPTLVSGVFECSAVDPNTLGAITVTSGAFNVESTTAVDPDTWGSVKALHR